MTEILFKEECYAIMGACFHVYRDKGCGFLEPVYQECCEIEFDVQKVPFLSQEELQLSYRSQPLRQRYKPDFICYGKIIVELKAVVELADEHRAQNAKLSARHGHETWTADQLWSSSEIGV